MEQRDTSSQSSTSSNRSSGRSLPPGSVDDFEEEDIYENILHLQKLTLEEHEKELEGLRHELPDEEEVEALYANTNGDENLLSGPYDNDLTDLSKHLADGILLQSSFACTFFL